MMTIMRCIDIRNEKYAQETYSIQLQQNKLFELIHHSIQVYEQTKMSYMKTNSFNKL